MILKPPRRLPPFLVLYDDLRSVGASPEAVAKYLGVSLSTVYRWLAGAEPPRPSVLALYWISKWGLSAIDAELSNTARLAQAMADARAREVRELHAVIARISALGSFGAANDPTTVVGAMSAEFPPRPQYVERLPKLSPLPVTLTAAM
jgi:transcriptional regulator with XRE-family HTH domain